MNVNKKEATRNAQMFKELNQPHLVQLVEYVTKTKATETNPNVFQDKVEHHYLNDKNLLSLLDSDK